MGIRSLVDMRICSLFLTFDRRRLRYGAGVVESGPDSSERRRLVLGALAQRGWIIKILGVEKPQST
jgi:hypothetical protein